MTRLSKFKLMLKEEQTEYNVDGKRQYTAPEDIAELALNFTDLKYECEEYIYCICFDTRLHVLGFFEAAHGSKTRAACSMKNIFQKALFLDADGIVMVHNHPSGDCDPSQEDYLFTEKVEKAGEILGVRFLDHIVVAPSGECYSIKCEKYFSKKSKKSIDIIKVI